MPWFVKIEEGIVDKQTFDQYVPAHLAFVQDLIDKGHHAQTGYWQQKGGGMLLFEASSMEEAKAIVARDPLIVNACVHYKLYEWHVVLGDPTGLDQCKHSDQTSELSPSSLINRVEDCVEDYVNFKQSKPVGMRR